MKTYRNQFITELFDRIEKRQYILLKFVSVNLDQLDEFSDIDLLFNSRKECNILEIIEDTDSVAHFTTISQSTMQQHFVYFRDGSFLEIDCLFQLSRKEFIYLDNEYLFENRIKINNYWTYTLECLFEHVILFNVLNDAKVPAKYIEYFNTLPLKKSRGLLEYFRSKYDASCYSLNELGHFCPLVKSEVINTLKKQPQNSLINRKLTLGRYLLDIAGIALTNDSKVITFSGVDGAGKSTIIAETKEIFEKKFRKKVVVLRHRPSLLPIISAWRYGKKGAEERSMATLPRNGGNKSKLASLARFGYYYVDYFVGQMYVFLKYRIRNYTILYDRYYFDFIVDARRTNIQMNQSFPKSLYRFVAKPDYNFFLYASPEVILERKKELPSSDIVNLTADYKSLFDEFSANYRQTYLPIENINKEETLDTIFQELNMSR